MKRQLSYLLSLTPGFVTIIGNMAGGVWVWSNLIFSLGLLSILEWFVPAIQSNDANENSILPDGILIFHLFFQILALSTLFYSIKTGAITGSFLIGAAISNGIHTGSSSIVIAHEMIHRKQRLWQWAGKFLLFTAGNCYFFIEHLKVHHKWVGTDKDPATAHFGENVYRFFLRSVTGQITGSWKIESERIQKENASFFSNYVILSLLGLVTVNVLLFVYVAPVASAVYMLVVLISNFLLEYTNYIEHYGLKRELNERVKEKHSWQSNKVISRFVLVDLSRHSDHHYYASKPFHVLKSYEESPVLPGGYASAVYLALIPPLWFKVIHKRMEEYAAKYPPVSL